MIDDVSFLTVEEVVAIHADQVDRYGGDRGLRDRGLLGSAVHAARNVAAYVISVATKALGKPEIATTLRSLIAPVAG